MLAMLCLKIYLYLAKGMQGYICKGFLLEFVNHKISRQFSYSNNYNNNNRYFFGMKYNLGCVSNAGGL